MVTAAASQTRDWARLRRGCRGLDVAIEDITEDQAMLGLMGPRARDVLGPLTGASLADEDFPFAAAQFIDAAGVEVLAIRMSYVGELGWELYVANADAVTVFDALVAAGEPHGLVLAGYHAMNTLRLESGYRHWGHDISPADTPPGGRAGVRRGMGQAGGLLRPGRPGGSARAAPHEASRAVPAGGSRTARLPRRAGPARR